MLAWWLLLSFNSSLAWGGPHPQLTTTRKASSGSQRLAGKVTGSPTATSEDKRTSGPPQPPSPTATAREVKEEEEERDILEENIEEMGGIL